ncbi:MAG: sugar phosphate isomerase/epimerase [Oscillospiraceae bacterium]|jgi:sugar phosphate isomerase/epimerase|nr:sugar phosphate isomerase/epimerase [Oscillospiraceae bacterium]
MRIGIQTSGLQQSFTPTEMFRLIHDSGFNCVDFNLDVFLPWNDIESGRKTTELDGTWEETRAALEPFKTAAVNSAVGFYQAHAPFPIPMGNERMVRATKRCLEACAYLECGNLIVHPIFEQYSDRKRLDSYDEWNTNIAFYSGLIPVCKDTGVRVCMENMFTGYNGRKMQAPCSDMEEAVRYVDTLNGIAGFDCFGFCLDTGHAMLFAQDQERAVKTLGSRLSALHLNDNDGRDDLHFAPYMGAVDWDAVAAGLKAVSYPGALCFETGGSVGRFDPKLYPELLRLIAAAGRLLWERIHN